MEKIKITLETLYDILRNEKKREDLQKLESTFFFDIVSYVRGKKMLIKQKSDSDELFASGEKDKLEYELRSIKRILKEIYEKREKKIIDIAMNRSRTGSDIIDTSAMLREEQEFYRQNLEILDHYRKGILQNLFNANLPDLDLGKSPINLNSATPKQPSSFSKFEPKAEESSPLPENPTLNDEGDEEDNGIEEGNDEGNEGGEDDEDLLPSPEEDKKEKKTETKNTTKTTETTETTLRKTIEPLDKITTAQNISAQKQELTKIKFLHPVPSFIWKDLKVYGPYEAGDIIEIFPEVAGLMVRKGRAEIV